MNEIIDIGLFHLKAAPVPGIRTWTWGPGGVTIASQVLAGDHLCYLSKPVMLLPGAGLDINRIAWGGEDVICIPMATGGGGLYLPSAIW